MDVLDDFVKPEEKAEMLKNLFQAEMA